MAHHDCYMSRVLGQITVGYAVLHFCLGTLINPPKKLILASDSASNQVHDILPLSETLEESAVRKDCLLSSNKSSSALSTQCLRNHSFRILSPSSFYRTSLFVCCARFFSPPLGLSEPSVATARRLTLRLSTAITSLHCSLRD